MAQEKTDLSSSFFTLNVNAMEFVPSFVTATPPAPQTEAPSPAEAPPTPPADPEPANDIEPQAEAPEPTVVIATVKEALSDKTPENPG